MKLSPVDLVVVILTGTVFLFFMLIAVEQLLTEEGISPEKVKIINAIIVTSLGIIGVYVGNKMNKK